MGTKRIIGLNATTDFESDDYIAVDGSTAGTRKMAQSVLKEKLRDSTLSDIHNLTAATDFATGDTIVVDNANDGPRGMDKDVLLAKTAQNALGSIKNLATTITSFRTGDVIPVDGPNGTAKMPKDDLLAITAQSLRVDEKLNADSLYSLDGQNLTFVSSPLFVIENGIDYKIHIGSLGWAITSLTSDSQYVLYYYSVARDGTKHVIKSWQRQTFADIPQDFTFRVTNGDIGVVIEVRADVGESVSFGISSLVAGQLDYLRSETDILDNTPIVVDGNGIYSVVKKFSVIPNRTYHISYDTTDWVFTKTSDSQRIVEVSAKQSDGTNRIIYSVRAGDGLSTLRKDMDVALQSGEIELDVSVKADVGKSARFSLSNVDETDALVKSAIANVSYIHEYVYGNGIYSITNLYNVDELSGYKVSFDTTNWTFDNYTSTSQRIVEVNAKKKDGTSRLLFKVSAGDGIAAMPSFVDVSTAEGEFNLSISIKADLGKYASYEIEKLCDNPLCLLTNEDQTKLNDYTKHFLNSGDGVALLFFTDPHSLLSNSYDWKLIFDRQMSKIYSWYRKLLVDAVLSGGDWLTKDTTQEQAVLRLAYMSGWLNSSFENVMQLVGNHDTNYQGVVSADDPSRGDLPTATLDNIMSRKFGKCYYRNVVKETAIYCFDSGIDWDNTITAYRLAQLKWFATSLLTEEKAHSIVAVHIVTNSGVVQNFAQWIFDIAFAYNTRSSIVVDGVTFNFSGATGKVEFGIAGHTHSDAVVDVNGIKVIVTRNVGNDYDSNVTFDLILADYDARKVYCTRVGDGADREVSI